MPPTRGLLLLYQTYAVGKSGPTAFRFLRSDGASAPSRRSDASILMCMSFECVSSLKCSCFGTGARTLLLLAMSLGEITALGSSLATCTIYMDTCRKKSSRKFKKLGTWVYRPF